MTNITALDRLRARWRIAVAEAKRELGTFMVLVGTLLLVGFLSGGFFLLIILLSPAPHTETPADAAGAGIFAGFAATMIVGGLMLRGTL